MKRSNGYDSSNSRARYRTTPALGVILMLAITLLFVAMLGAFSFGITFESLTTPQASMSTELDVPNNQITISHIGGDSLPSERTGVVIINESDGRILEFRSAQVGDSFEVGQTIVIDTATGSLDGWSLDDGARPFDLRRGVTYTIKVVDSNSENTIYRTSLTAA